MPILFVLGFGDERIHTGSREDSLISGPVWNKRPAAKCFVWIKGN